MNKLAIVLGAAAVVTFAGCKDPEYARVSTASQNDVKNAESTEVTPVETSAPKKCQCPAGTKHTKPCACGLADCMCIVETKPVVTKTAEPEYTLYTVRNGDYLAKISKKFNVTIASIKKLNGLKSDVVRVGQKIKLPGKIDVGAEPVVAAKSTAAAKPAASAKKAKKPYEAYKGATKEYVVKAGDTLGAIAYGNGCNIRQLKELNGLTKDALKVGQKLKVPAEGKSAAKAETKVAEKPVEQKADAPAPVAAPAAEAPAENAAAPAAESAPAESASKDEPAAENPTYVVQEGEDLMGVAIRWNVSSAAIRELNNLPEGAQLKAGQVLKLPAEAQQ